MTDAAPQPEEGQIDGSELDRVDDAIQHAKALQQEPPLDETTPAGPFFDAEPAFVDTGELSRGEDDQTIAPG
jgi:hypothetical protein